MILTDDDTPLNYPDNIQVEYLSFASLAERVQSKFDFPIALTSPKKLCDFKPAYGYIFQEYIEGYAFWGHCDCDLLFGKISDYFCGEMLDQYDLYFSLGHLTIYRNCDSINQLFMADYLNESAELRSYREVLSLPQNLSFDEWPNNRVNIRALAIQEKTRVCYDRYFYDIKPYRSMFINGMFDYVDKYELSYGMHNAIFTWSKGLLTAYWLEQSSLVSKQFIYVHFQKRKMDVRKADPSSDSFLIVPNKIISIADLPDEKFLIRHMKRAKIRQIVKIDEITRTVVVFRNLWIHRFKKYVLRKS